MSIYQSIQDFISLALQNGTIEPLDELYHRNQLLHFLGLNDWAEVDKEVHETNSLILMDQLLAIANENNVIAKGQDEFYEAALMNFMTPRPSKINHDFWGKYQASPDAAT